MSQLLISRFLMLCLMMVASIVSHAATGDINVLKAREAFDQENAVVLAQYVDKLQSQQHILAPYAQYWLMTLNLQSTDNKTISTFLAQHEDHAFTQRLRGNFLKKLGRDKNWALFTQEYAHYQTTKNTAVECLAAESYATQNVGASLTFAKHLWLSEKDQPRECNDLFDLMESHGVIDEEAIWQRFRMATAKNRVSLAKAIIKRSNAYRSNQQNLISRAYKAPATFLKKNLVSFNTRFGHEVNLFALVRMARNNTWQSVSAYKKIAHQLSDEEKQYFHAMLGLFAAKRHEPEAQLWFQKANINTLNHEQISWYARAALRESDWQHLLTIITKMKPEVADEARWRYWKARALIALKQDKQKAVDILTKLGVERHYYGWLAQDELQNYTPPTLIHYEPTNKEVVQIGTLMGVQRTAALLRLDLRWEGRLEWKKAIEHFDDKKLLAAARFADRQQWYDLAINTADDTRGIHDFSMRYLMPYKRLMTQAAQEQGVDVTWVHGITRQESRFMHYAKSHAGATGLMQLMPTTARWAAKRAGVNNYKRSMINDLDTNVTIGTYYLRYALDMMGGNKIMATAGYNAGPSRAKKWLGSRVLEGPIYAETIPFNETRGYVQRVMANMHMYDQQLGVKGLTLKQLMGHTPAKPAS